LGIQIFLSDDLEAVEHVAHDAVALPLLDVAIGERNVEYNELGEVIRSQQIAGTPTYQRSRTDIIGSAA
jgi:hypothetical protein